MWLDRIFGVLHRSVRYVVLLAVFAAIWTIWNAAPTPAQQIQAYSIAPSFPDSPARGPENATGLVLWNTGFPTIGPPSPSPALAILKGLAVRGWDVMSINRPTADGSWTTVGQQHVSTLIGQVVNAQQSGYGRVVLAGDTLGASIALEAADRKPVYGVIAFAPARAKGNSQAADNARYTLAQIKGINAERVFVALAGEDTPSNSNQTTALRQVLDARKSPYVLVDSWPLGANGDRLTPFLPFANCGITFLDPNLRLRTSEFHCYHDELGVALAAAGETLNGANAVWLGYDARSAQIILVITRPTGSGLAADYFLGTDILDRQNTYIAHSVPARWTGNVLSFGTPPALSVTLQPDQTSGFWQIKENGSRGSLTGTLTLLAATK
ncbi:MAG TPA: hypothetical protein VGG27_07530 [Magnetospirillaceae bacterium]|jgi:hypothetical protein